MTNKKLYSITFVSNFVKLFFNVIIGIITVPISIEYWKSEKYGIWLLINSVLVYLTASNLGLNAASSILMNKESCITKKFSILKKSFFVLSISTFVLISLFFIFNLTVPNWISFLGKIEINLRDEAQMACFILMLFFFINLPFALFASAFQGFHKVYIENFILIINGIFLFLALLLNIKLKGDLVFFALLIGGTNLFTNIIRAILFYVILYKNNKIDKSETSSSNEYSYRSLIKLGLRCFSGSLASMIVLNTDNLVISHFLGVNHVTPYAVTFKLFTILFNLIFIINSSLVPVLGRLIGEGDIKKSEKIFKYTSYLIMYIGGGIFIGSLAFFKNVILNWAGIDGFAGTGTLIFLGAYSYVFCVVNLNYIIINTFDYLKGSTWIVWGEAIVNISVSILLSKKIGLTGIALGTFMGTLIFPTIFFPIVIKKKSSKKIKFDLKQFIMHSILVLVFVLLAFGIHVRNLSFILNIFLTLLLLGLYSFMAFVIVSKDDKKEIKLLVLNKFLRKDYE